MVGHRTGADYRKRFRVGVEFSGLDQEGQLTRRIEYAASGNARVTPRIPNIYPDGLVTYWNTEPMVGELQCFFAVLVSP